MAIIEANCPDHYWMKWGGCSSGTQIVCLLNQLVSILAGEWPLDSAVG